MLVVMSNGLGVDSAEVLRRWLTEPASRDFDLTDLVVVTAMTGDEFPDTQEAFETHLLPLFRRHGVRFVQLARRGPDRVEGEPLYVVLDDSRCPERLHLAGAYRLSQEMLAAGTVPTTAGNRLCSQHAKGEVIDTWLAATYGKQVAYRHVMGFNADEQGRAERDRDAGKRFPNRQADYPLLTWAAGRAACEANLTDVFGIKWPKSCCVFCPFTMGRPDVLARFHRYPGRAADAAWMEHVALALNPRMCLYRDKTVRAALEKSGNRAALDDLEGRLNDPGQPWAVYRVRRMFRAAGLADRCVAQTMTGTRAEAEAALARQADAAGVPVAEEAGSLRAWLRRRDPQDTKGLEEMLVACPAVANDKKGRGFNEAKWVERTTPAAALAA